jgi:hypothetical protein
MRVKSECKVLQLHGFKSVRIYAFERNPVTISAVFRMVASVGLLMPSSYAVCSALCEKWMPTNVPTYVGC